MNVIHQIEDLSRLQGPLHLAIGVFDGLHPGHRAVIEDAVSSARETGGIPVVVTFDPHPIRVLAPEKAPRLLASLPHQILILSKMGLKHLLVIRFDREFASQPAETFIRDLSSAADIARISVGADWRFGRGREGDTDLLRKLGEELGFALSGVPLVEIEGDPISSTRIREAISTGDFKTAESLLGRPYTVLGTVIEGRKLARTLGFPTANLTVHSEQLPPPGVYVIRASGAGDSWDGVGNLGFRPTVEGEEAKLLLEVHLFGLDHDIYGEDIEVEFVKFLRGERKFDGLGDLKKQIQLDVEEARSTIQ